MNDKTNIKYLCLDKDLKTLSFFTQKGAFISWNKDMNDHWMCPLDKESINNYYNNVASLTATDFLYYYVDELINDWAQKTKVLNLILKLENHLKNFSKLDFYYPTTSSHRLESKNIMPGGSVDPKHFILNNSCQLYSESDLNIRKKSYAKLCAILSNIDDVWQDLDNELKKYGVKDSTPIAATYKGAKMTSAVYYYQLKDILPPAYGASNYSEKKLAELKLHDYKIDSRGEWSVRDTAFADDEIAQKRNIEYLKKFNLPEIQGQWLVEVEFVDASLKNRGDHYDDDSSILIKEMAIKTNGIFLGKNVKDFSRDYSSDCLILAQLKNGQVESLIPIKENKKLNSYCLEINIALEKAQLDKELVVNPASVNKPIHKSKI